MRNITVRNVKKIWGLLGCWVQFVLHVVEKITRKQPENNISIWQVPNMCYTLYSEGQAKQSKTGQENGHGTKSKIGGYHCCNWYYDLVCGSCRAIRQQNQSANRKEFRRRDSHNARQVVKWGQENGQT